MEMSILEKYKHDQKKYDDFRIKSELLLKELMIHKKINFHKIESRLKDEKKLEEKITRKNNKYKDICEITDIVGLRVIAYFEDEVDKIAEIIEKEFIKDPINSIDKRNLETDRFGYKSLHYVVELSEERKNLTEYKRFKDLKIEIQIRSVLQHAWAEIEHDIGYKGELSVPNSLKRNFYRVAALLETADLEFIRIKNQVANYEKTIEREIEKNPDDVEINLTSLTSYILNSKIVHEIDKQLTTNSNIGLDSEIKKAEPNDINKLYYLKVTTIKDLDALLKTKKEKILAFAKEFLGQRSSKSNMRQGISIFYLCYVLVGETNDYNFALEYFKSQIGGGIPEITKRNADQLISIVNKLN